MRRRLFLRAGAIGAGALASGTLSGCRPALEAGAPGPSPEVGGAGLPAAIAALQRREPPKPISEEERSARRENARRIMAELGVDAMFLEPGTNLDYFAGIGWGRSERLFGLLLPRSGEPVVISPAFEEQRAANVVRKRFPIRVWQEDESPSALIAGILKDRGIVTGTLAVDDTARYFVAYRLANEAPALRITTAEPILHATRGIKSAHELELMRFANRVTLEALGATFSSMRAGMMQSELGRLYRQALTQLGFVSGSWALTLIGESSAYPHGADAPQPLREGDVVLIDAGTGVHGYEADITRTQVFGEPNAEQQRVFDAVHTAQQAALRYAAPGRTAGSVDAVARRVIEERRFGKDYELFTHRLGHGIGLEGHEWPYLVRGSDVVLRPGMTFSNEPGIYQYGKFGVRLEDIMVITDAGAELLTPAAESLTYLLT